MTDRKWASRIIGAGILLLLSACSEPADAPEAIADNMSQPPQEEVAAPVQPAPEAPAKPATASLLTEQGYDGIAIGAKAAGTALQFEAQEEEYDCTYGRLAGNERVYFMIISGEVARIDIEDPAEDRLPNGIGVGSTGDEVMAAYPTAEISPHKYVDDAHYYEVTLTSGLGLVFEETEGRVTSFRIGRFPEVSYVEGCS